MAYVKIAIVLIMISGAAGAIVYVQHLRSENAILTANNAKLDDVIQAKEAETEALKSDFAIKSDQLRKRNKQIIALQRKAKKLSGELQNVTKDDPKTIECLEVVPGPDFVDKLREYTGSQGSDADPEVVSRAEFLREPDPVRPHG